MKTIEVKGMNCGHCVKKITLAINKVDPDAVVKVDLTQGHVSVAQCNVTDESIENAINEAGYTAASWVHHA